MNTSGKSVAGFQVGASGLSALESAGALYAVMPVKCHWFLKKQKGLRVLCLDAQTHQMQQPGHSPSAYEGWTGAGLSVLFPGLCPSMGRMCNMYIYLLVAACKPCIFFKQQAWREVIHGRDPGTVGWACF